MEDVACANHIVGSTQRHLEHVAGDEFRALAQAQPINVDAGC